MTIDELMSDMPEEFRLYMLHIKALNFTEKPDYKCAPPHDPFSIALPSAPTPGPLTRFCGLVRDRCSTIDDGLAVRVREESGAGGQAEGERERKRGSGKSGEGRGWPEGPGALLRVWGGGGSKTFLFFSAAHRSSHTNTHPVHHRVDRRLPCDARQPPSVNRQPPSVTRLPPSIGSQWRDHIIRRTSGPFPHDCCEFKTNGCAPRPACLPAGMPWGCGGTLARPLPPLAHQLGAWRCLICCLPFDAHLVSGRALSRPLLCQLACLWCIWAHRGTAVVVHAGGRTGAAWADGIHFAVLPVSSRVRDPARAMGRCAG